MDEVTVRPGERHHHGLPGPGGCQRGHRGRARRRLESLVIMAVGGRFCCARSVSISGVRFAGACWATEDVITILLKNSISSSSVVNCLTITLWVEVPDLFWLLLLFGRLWTSCAHSRQFL